MGIISLIAAIDERGGLGKENKLLCHLPADLKHFKELTLGKPIIMGRKTYQSIGKALPGRENIVLSKQNLSLDDATVVHSLEEALSLTKAAPEVMIIGGAKVFEEAMQWAHRIYLTEIHGQFDADVFFPEIDKTKWHCQDVIERPEDEKNHYKLSFYRYEALSQLK